MSAAPTRLGAQQRARAFVALAERASSSLSLYLRRFVWPVIEPATPYVHGWHIDAIAAHLEAVSAGEIRQLIVNIPPRTMKSTTVSVAWPTWEWLRVDEPGVMGPHTRWMFASYAALLSTRDSLKSRRVIESPKYQRALAALYDGTGREPWKLTGDQNVKTKFENTATGFRMATSVGAAATGEGGDRIVADDPLNAMEAASEAVLASTDEWWSGAMSTRLNDPKTGAKVIVMQRLHENDTVGLELQRNADEWVHLCLPMRYDPAHPYAWRGERLSEIVRPRLPAHLKNGDPRTQDRELLIPDRMGDPEVDSIARRLGSYRASGQLQQLPAPAEGGIFQRKWWRYYVTAEWANAHGRPDNAVIAPERSEMEYWLQSWDMAFKDEDAATGEPDYVVGQTWATRGAFKYLIWQRRAHLDFPATRKAVIDFGESFPAAYLKLIEDKANGPAIIAELRGKVPGLLAVEPEGGKIARANAVSWMVEAGDVFIPHPLMYPWADDFVNECSSFPNGAHDDQVDAMTQALRRLGGGGAGTGADLWE